jgi:hypothetical protein
MRLIDMTPIRMNPVMLSSNRRKTVKSPTENSPTSGQKMISARLKKFLLVMIQFLNAKAPI